MTDRSGSMVKSCSCLLKLRNPSWMLCPRCRLRKPIRTLERIRLPKLVQPFKKRLTTTGRGRSHCPLWALTYLAPTRAPLAKAMPRSSRPLPESTQFIPVFLSRLLRVGRYTSPPTPHQSTLVRSIRALHPYLYAHPQPRRFPLYYRTRLMKNHRRRRFPKSPLLSQRLACPFRRDRLDRDQSAVH